MGTRTRHGEEKHTNYINDNVYSEADDINCPANEINSETDEGRHLGENTIISLKECNFFFNSDKFGSCGWGTGERDYLVLTALQQSLECANVIQGL